MTLWSIFSVKIYSVVTRKNEIMLHCNIDHPNGMDIMLNEVSQKDKEKYQICGIYSGIYNNISEIKARFRDLGFIWATEVRCMYISKPLQPTLL